MENESVWNKNSGADVGRILSADLAEEQLIVKMCICRTYHAGILLVQQLVPCCQGVPVLLLDEVFHFLIGQVNAIVEVSAPENIVVGVQQATLAGANM